MTNKLNISVSGGALSLGVATQGDNSTSQGTAFLSQTAVDHTLATAKQALENLAREKHYSQLELDAALEQIALLSHKATEQPQNTDDGMKILKLMRENFEWAYPVVKDFVKVVWPILLGPVGA